MTRNSQEQTVPADAAGKRSRSHHYRELLWQTLTRQILLYFIPLLLLAAFFHFQYRRLIRESQRAHLIVIAEQQANTLDLFLRERLVNLGNLADDPQFKRSARAPQTLADSLSKLRQTNDAFADLGVVDGEGNLVGYEGPVKFSGPVGYASEAWFRRIAGESNVSVITDVYLGLRGQPHFTIAVKRNTEQGPQIIRSALSPDALLEYRKSLEGAHEVNAVVVNADGAFQLVAHGGDATAPPGAVLPPREPRRGALDGPKSGEESWPTRGCAKHPGRWSSTRFPARARHKACSSARTGSSPLPSCSSSAWAWSSCCALARSWASSSPSSDTRPSSPGSSSTLPSSPRWASSPPASPTRSTTPRHHRRGGRSAQGHDGPGVRRPPLPPPDLVEHLDVMHEAVFRCRDITCKLLTFVRQTDIKIEPHRVEKILDDVISGMLGNELMLANVEIVKRYDGDQRTIETDRNQFVQVFLNLIKNAFDAMPHGGTLTVETRHRDKDVVIAIRDTGCGMTPDQMKRVFLPFFTTNAPGKGTGLGLSVSASILKNFGGNIFVESVPGAGSQFTIELPYAIPD